MWKKRDQVRSDNSGDRKEVDLHIHIKSYSESCLSDASNILQDFPLLCFLIGTLLSL